MIGRTREVLALIGLALAMAILIIFDSVISNQTYCTIYFVLFIIFMIAIFELLVKRLQKSSISTLSRYF
jgi:ABC-type bacteriocin/lantibiotic exporter with double-glycine peptidase domain